MLRGSWFLISWWILLSSTIVVLGEKSSFNYEVEKRILDRLVFYMNQSVDVNQFLANARYSTMDDDDDSFFFGFTPANRDRYVRSTYHLPLSSISAVYVAMEDGSLTGFKHLEDRSYGYYREPGNGGYLLSNGTGQFKAANPDMNKHLKSCVDSETGAPQDCILQPGDSYIQCVNDCELVPCPQPDKTGNATKPDCTGLHRESSPECADTAYCQHYEIKQVKEENHRGYVPLSYFCHDVRGKFTQEQGQVSIAYAKGSTNYNLYSVMSLDGTTSSFHQLGNCYYGDGTTLVNRSLEGDYAYCGGNGTICSTTFAGGFQSLEFDPRYRPWYMQSKRQQQPWWVDPYVFYDSLGLGITATHPIYDIVPNGKKELIKIFAGSLAIDYRLADISYFLEEAYGSSDNLVAIYEDKEPHYLIALSTGTPVTTLVLEKDPTKPCPKNVKQIVAEGGVNADEPDCIPVRQTMANLTGTAEDAVLVQSFRKQLAFGYPKELVTVVLPRQAEEVLPSIMWASQASLYTQEDAANLRWRFVVASPGVKSTTDSILVDGGPLFGLIIFMGALGFAVCVTFLGLFYAKRNEQAMIYSDWRFTCLFITGCALFSCSTFTLVGPNKDELCMLRMWSFHMLFVMTLSPLFVKIWRIWKLVGASGIPRRTQISHMKTFLYTLPPIGIQAIILLAISVADPPRQKDSTSIDDGVLTHHVTCGHETNALFVTEIIFEGSLIVIGCFLAYKQRKMDKKYGESVMLMFAMYNVALALAFYLIVAAVANVDKNGQKFFRAFGVFWISVVCSASFVIPKLVQVRREAIMLAEKEKQQQMLRAAYPAYEGEHTENTPVEKAPKPVEETHTLPVQNC